MGGFGERLASLPAVPRDRAPGDGTEPTNGEEEQSGIAQPPAKTLADADDATKFKTVDALIRSQERLARNRWAIDTHFRRIRAGVPFSRLEKIPNQSVWVAKLPNGMAKESAASVPNKADDLCNKVEDTLMADPAKPDPMPHVEDDSAEQAATIAAQFLSMDGGEAGTNDAEVYRWALNNAFTGASSYCHYVINTSGGGYQPLQKLAHPKSEDPSNPLVAMVPLQAPAPLPGMPPAPPQMIEERTSDPVLRYVSAPDEAHPAGQFVEDASQADRVWLPKIEIERFRRENVRCFPAAATIEQAAAVIFIRHHPLSQARALWPKTVGTMKDDELSALASWKPSMAEQLVTYAFKGNNDGTTGPSLDEVGSLSPMLQRRMFSYRLYVKASPEYPGGYWCDLSGAKSGTLLDEGDLEYEVTLPTQGKTKRCRDIPGTQVRPMQDVDGGDPTGWPFISRFAGASEAESTMYAAFMDLCDNMLHPHVFIRSTAAVDEDDWFDRSVPIILHPSDPEPTYERFPTLPPILPLLDNLDKKQDVISGLTETAQGLESSNSISGVAKNLTIQQAKVSLSGFQQNLHAAMTRGWRIKLQLAQAEFTTPQMMQYSGEEGSGQAQWWTGEDMAGIDRVGIQPGTGSMQTPEGKAQYVAFAQSQQWITPDIAAGVALPGIKMDLGLPEDPFLAAIERSIDTWLQGPPEGWEEQYAAQQQQIAGAQAQYQQQAAQLATQGQQAPAFAPPQLPALPNPFPSRPNDGEPAVATVYMKRLSKLFVDPKYAQQSPAWQTLPTGAYQKAVQALQPPPTLPKGVAISMKGDETTVRQEEQEAIAGVSKGAPPGAPQPPTPVTPKPAHIPVAPGAL